MKAAERITQAVDWAIGLVSPERAALRTHFRRMESDPGYRETTFALLGARGYRAAEKGTTTTPWSGSRGSADAESLQQLPELRSRSRELNRDDPIASGLTHTFVRNVIGTGLRPQARTGNPKMNTDLEAVYNERRDQLYPADGLTHAEAQQLLFRKVLEDGEILNHQRVKAGEALTFEIIECDRLGNPWGSRTQLKNGNQLRDGVEKDPDGVPVAYHVRKGHPGDIAILPRADAHQYERLLEETCRHLKFTQRPGQSRGVPMFHAILQDIHDLDLLLVASLKRMQIAACLSVFIKSVAGVDKLFSKTAEKYGYKIDQALEPGMIFKLNTDEEIQTLIPNFPPPELAGFVVTLARRIGAALGVSWQIVLKDFSDSTYSSARTDLLEARQAYTILRKWFIHKHLDWEWTAVLFDARLRGDRRLAGVTDGQIAQVEWFGDGWEWVDPQKEANSKAIALGAMLTTLEEEWIKLGKDPEEMWKRLKEQKAKLDELGLDWPGPKMGRRDLFDLFDVEDEEPRRRAQTATGGNGDGGRLPARRLEEVRHGA